MPAPHTIPRRCEQRRHRRAPKMPYYCTVAYCYMPVCAFFLLLRYGSLYLVLNTHTTTPPACGSAIRYALLHFGLSRLAPVRADARALPPACLYWFAALPAARNALPTCRCCGFWFCYLLLYLLRTFWFCRRAWILLRCACFTCLQRHRSAIRHACTAPLLRRLLRFAMTMVLTPFL